MLASLVIRPEILRRLSDLSAAEGRMAGDARDSRASVETGTSRTRRRPGGSRHGPGDAGSMRAMSHAAAARGRSLHLQLRVHLLRLLRDDAGGDLLELRRRARAAPPAARPVMSACSC